MHSVQEQRRIRYILRLCCDVEKNNYTFPCTQNFAIPYVNVQRWLKHWNLIQSMSSENRNYWTALFICIIFFNRPPKNTWKVMWNLATTLETLFSPACCLDQRREQRLRICSTGPPMVIMVSCLRSQKPHHLCITPGRSNSLVTC